MVFEPETPWFLFFSDSSNVVRVDICPSLCLILILYYIEIYVNLYYHVLLSVTLKNLCHI